MSIPGAIALTVGVVTWRRLLANRVGHRSGFSRIRQLIVPPSQGSAPHRSSEPMDRDVRTQPIGERRARDRKGRQRLRNQWPILAEGALSTISGVGFAAVALADDTVHLGMLALYATTGGVFVIQAGLLASRSHRLPNPPPPCRLNGSVDVGWVSTSAEGSAASTRF